MASPAPTEDLRFECPDVEATLATGRALAGRLLPGDLVLLTGELGVGKTVFVRGLAEGLGIEPLTVSSPTFSLVHEYGPDGQAPVVAHVDLYRLAGEGEGELEELGLRELRRQGAILAIEWPARSLLETGAWVVEIRYLGEERREILIRRVPPPPPAVRTL